MKKTLLILLIAIIPALTYAQKHGFISYEYSKDENGKFTYHQKKMLSIIIYSDTLILGGDLEKSNMYFIQNTQGESVENKLICSSGLTVWLNHLYNVAKIEDNENNTRFTLYGIKPIDL